MKKMLVLSAAFLALTAACFGETTASRPSQVELTVYNQNFALVKEERQINLESGINLVSVQDVAAQIEPSSVAFKSKTDPMSVVVREQNYQYDLIEPTAILNKSVGKRVVVRRTVNGQVEEITGTLLNPASVMVPQTQEYYGYGSSYEARLMNRNNGLVVKTDRGLVMFPNYMSGIDSIEVLELPEGLAARPTLVWKLETNKPGAHRTEVSYLTNYITWKADYVAVVDALDKYVDITGWVTLDNNSGATYENAKLNLMAGDVHRVEQRRLKGMGGGRGGAMGPMAAPEPQFAEKSFFEYHLYTLNDRTTVKDKESKQITLLSAARVPANKTYIYDGRKAWWSIWRYGGDYRPGESYDVSPNKKVNVFVEVMNKKENNLGIPLPKGTVRVYKQEADANQHFVGEDEIDHTPKDEKIRLYLGDAFDIVGEHARTNFRRLSPTEVEESFQITLRNHKDAAVSVVIVEHLPSDWRILQSSHKGFKKDASTLEFPVQIPKDGEVVVTYTARTKW